MARFPAGALVVLVGVAVFILMPLPSQGASLDTPASTCDALESVRPIGNLPVPLDSAGEAFDGNRVWVVGGKTGDNAPDRADIYAIDPTNGQVTKDVAVLPKAETTPTVTWNSQAHQVWIFAGYSPSGFSHAIYSFDPTTHAIATLPAVDPTSTTSSAIATPNASIVFGGYPSSSDVFSYDGGSTMPVIASLGKPLQDPAAAFDGRYAYLLGGYSGVGNAYYDTILKFDTLTLNVSVLPATLPHPITDAYAVWVDGCVFSFGGQLANSSLTDEIVSFDPSTNQSRVVGHLPTPITRLAASPASTPSGVILVGGANAAGSSVDQVLRATFTSTVAQAKTTTGSVSLFAQPWRLAAAAALLGGAGYVFAKAIPRRNRERGSRWHVPLWLAALYHRVTKPDALLAQPVREGIYRELKQSRHPRGVAEISRKVNTSENNARAHLQRLERHKIVKSERVGRERVYSLAGQKPNWVSPAQARTLREIERAGPLSVRELAEALGISPSGAWYHVRRLRGAELVQDVPGPRTTGSPVRFQLTDIGRDVLRRF